MCRSENFELDRPCPDCGYRGEASPLDRLGSILEDVPVPTPDRPRLPSLTGEEAEKAWLELARLEMLLEKVDLWREAGYFKKEVESLDPVKGHRAQAEELRMRLEQAPRPEAPQTDTDQIKTLGFLMDQVDLIASRGWFKSKREIKKAVMPILAMMLDVISGDAPE